LFANSFVYNRVQKYFNFLIHLIVSHIFLLLYKMIHKFIIVAFKLFNIFYCKTGLCLYEFKFYKRNTRVPFICLLKTKKWQKIIFIVGFINMFLLVLLTLHLMIKCLSSGKRENWGNLGIIVLAHVTLILGMMCVITILRDTKDVPYILHLAIKTDAHFEGNFKFIIYIH